MYILSIAVAGCAADVAAYGGLWGAAPSAAAAAADDGCRRLHEGRRGASPASTFGRRGDVGEEASLAAAGDGRRAGAGGARGCHRPL